MPLLLLGSATRHPRWQEKKTLNEIDFYKIEHQDRFYEAGSLSVCNVLIYKAFAYIKLYMQALNINPFELLQ